MRRCEERHALRLAARMRDGAGWQDVAIENVSAHGMMLSSGSPPRPGSYVEIRRAAALVVARIMWRRGRHFGVRSQDMIDVALLTAKRIASSTIRENATDRRKSVRVAHDEARAVGTIIQAVFLVATVIILAALLTLAVYRSLAHPFAAARRALTPQLAVTALFERAA